MQPSQSLKLGLLIDPHIQPAWVESALQTAVNADLVDITLVVQNIDRRSLKNKIWRNLPYAIYYLYEFIDKLIYNIVFSSVPDPLAPTNISHLTSAALEIRVEPKRSLYFDFIEDKDLEIIRNVGCDVLLRLGFRILQGGVLKATPLWVWSWHHGDPKKYRGGPNSF